ncbi:DNA-binding transcriptional regulator, FadR family [Gordonia malaquae]|uniref:Putative GntR family transcriptional regulator n=1 Tax=Gordonia malaquae NBRC 108250 TaxID=1223542 RepID=M3UHZ0_GORML|nr:GntR family transcriptional regulator [Gordonia malaquae]GAC79015.1 putative GntR family transcriptional regulator [Gordonia malaquae NBRC 108250]SEB63589.1 DNA-binding transcriptional regulator, FadR family [Gordonia malaquae]
MSTAPIRSASAVFRPLRSGSLVDQITDRILDAAESGLLQPGQRLPNEAEFAAALGVSALTIREALSRLRSEKVVVTTRGRTGGSFISPALAPSTARAEDRLRELTRLEISEMAAHFEALAVGCARAAARRAGTADVVALRAITVIDPDVSDLSVAWRQVETEFIIEVATIARIARLSRALMSVQSEYGVLTLLPNEDSDYRYEVAGLRNDLTDRLEARDESAAASTMRGLIAANTTWLLTRRAELM